MTVNSNQIQTGVLGERKVTSMVIFGNSGEVAATRTKVGSFEIDALPVDRSNPIPKLKAPKSYATSSRIALTVTDLYRHLGVVKRLFT